MISKKMSIKLSMIPLILGSASQMVLADSAAKVTKDDTEVISIIGSRSTKERTVADSPVPVDIINSDDINAIGGTADMTKNTDPKLHCNACYG